MCDDPKTLICHARYRPGSRTRHVRSRYPRILAVASDAGGGDIVAFRAFLDLLAAHHHEIDLIFEFSLTTTSRFFLAPRVTESRPAQGLSLCERLRKWTAHYYEVEHGSYRSTCSAPPFHDWAATVCHLIAPWVSSMRPSVVLTSLFSSEIGRRLRRRFSIPWHVVNPSFPYGPLSRRSLSEDFSGATLHLARRHLVNWQADADVVIHATCPSFDAFAVPLPRNHFYVGPLPPVLPDRAARQSRHPSEVLVTMSSEAQHGDQEMIKSTIEQLGGARRTLFVVGESAPAVAGIPGGASVRAWKHAEHGPLMRRSGVCVSHAGHGTVLKSIQIGCPLVLFPRGRDQPGVSARARALGVAIEVDHTQSGSIRHCVSRAVADSSLVETSRHWGSLIAAQAAGLRENTIESVYGLP